MQISGPPTVRRMDVRFGRNQFRIGVSTTRPDHRERHGRRKLFISKHLRAK